MELALDAEGKLKHDIILVGSVRITMAICEFVL